MRAWPSVWVALTLALALELAAPAAAAAPTATPSIDGSVLRVVDGDTLWLLPAQGSLPFAVRLRGIDAPEICQPWGPEARAALEVRLRGLRVSLRVPASRTHDGHGRMLATVVLDGVDINRELVIDGHAWSDRYRNDRGPYVKQERIAQALDRGLHAAGGAELPRDFRRRHGTCARTAG